MIKINAISRLFRVSTVALSSGVVLLMAGCGEEKKEPPKPQQQVRQKIVIEEQKSKADAPAVQKVAAGDEKTAGQPGAAPVPATPAPAGGEKKEEKATGLLTTHTKILEEKKLAAGEWHYDPVDKIDPFMPLLQEKTEKAPEIQGKLKRREVPLTPLTRVDLSQLKLTAIILASSGNKALVEEASGKGYVIELGTDIGNKAGRVAEIQIDKVVVEEEVENITGGYEVKKRELNLQKPPGEF